jgi:hypothetical protein
MKYTIILLSLFFVVGFFNTVIAQEKQSSQQNDKENVIIKGIVKDAVLHDPKLSPEEVAILKTAGQDNPVVIEENLDDPKMDPSEIPDESSFGESNAKAEPIVEREEIKPEKKAISTKPVSTNIQPDGK